MRPRRQYISKQVYFASDRIREGLPLVPDDLINALIKSILARAQYRYPLAISDLLFMNNHFHLVAICFDPKVVSDFFCYLKGELATTINKLLGRRGPVWEGRSDVVRLATVSSIIEKIIYLYTNPQSAGLVDSIEQYPGVNSWDAFINNRTEELCPWYMTHELRKIPHVAGEPRLRARLLEELTQEIEDEDGEKIPRKESPLTIAPLAWVKYFAEEITEQEARQRIIEGVREREAELRKTRRGSVVGSRKLKEQSIYKRYKPKKFGRRVFIICDDIELRKQLIEEYRSFVRECRIVFQRWLQGDFSLFFPPGAFAPPACRLASALA